VRVRSGLRIDAEAQLGEMLAAIPKEKSYTGFQQRNSVLPAGIDKKQSHYAQELPRYYQAFSDVK